VITISRILCPTDFSDLSRNALAQAAALARWYEAEITVLYVAPVAITAAEVAYVPAPWVSPEMREKLRADLHAFAEPARAQDITVRIDLCEGNPAAEILDTARTDAFDLIVMGTHGRQGLESWVLGSVTEAVLRASPCPVLTVAPRSRLAPTARFDLILCPVDFSPTSERTAHEAGLLAAETPVPARPLARDRARERAARTGAPWFRPQGLSRGRRGQRARPHPSPERGSQRRHRKSRLLGLARSRDPARGARALRRSHRHGGARRPPGFHPVRIDGPQGRAPRPPAPCSSCPRAPMRSGRRRRSPWAWAVGSEA
jgi:nucleotide-binding universal stress UspA family protein